MPIFQYFICTNYSIPLKAIGVLHNKKQSLGLKISLYGKGREAKNRPLELLSIYVCDPL